MTVLVENLRKEVDLLDTAGASAFTSIATETSALLEDLQELEASLEAEIEQSRNTDGKNASTQLPLGKKAKVLATPLAVESLCSKWYTLSISALKRYNHQISKYVKVVSSSKYRIDLDTAYTFPLMLDAYPTKEEGELVSKTGNKRELMKSIVMHLLKSGHGSAVSALLADCHMENDVDRDMYQQFQQLNGILDDIQVRHDLSSVIAWLETHSERRSAHMDEILFELHMLQFALCLTGEKQANAHMKAYMYAQKHFPRYFKTHASELAPVMTLLVDEQDGGSEFRRKVAAHFAHEAASGKLKSKFVGDILQHFEELHLRPELFARVAHEFVAEFCSGMALSSESALFESMLAGFVNLPNFYKYSQLQRRLSRHDPAPQELPFQLPDKNHFLFNHHPIFICPVSKEQLVPLSVRVPATDEDLRDRKRRTVLVSPTEKLVPMTNPVVVFDHCRHLALKDSVRSLTKGGTEVFKCHYCYKKHKLLEVSDAYFIDL